jgi:predicted branched-subunit amino acid permease
LAIAGIGAACMFAESYLNFAASSSRASLDNLASLAVVGPAVFVVVMKLNVRTNSKELALYSTGIYLVHVFVILIVQKTIAISPTALTVLAATVAAAITAVLIRLDRKLGFIL